MATALGQLCRVGQDARAKPIIHMMQARHEYYSVVVGSMPMLLMSIWMQSISHLPVVDGMGLYLRPESTWCFSQRREILYNWSQWHHTTSNVAELSMSIMAIYSNVSWDMRPMCKQLYCQGCIECTNASLNTNVGQYDWEIELHSSNFRKSKWRYSLKWNSRTLLSQCTCVTWLNKHRLVLKLFRTNSNVPTSSIGSAKWESVFLPVHESPCKG